MVSINDHQNETGEVTQVILSLLGVASEQELHDVVQWLGEPLNVNPSEELPSVVFDALLEVKASDGGNNIEQEGCFQIMKSNIIEKFVSIGALEEAQNDL